MTPSFRDGRVLHLEATGISVDMLERISTPEWCSLFLLQLCHELGMTALDLPLLHELPLPQGSLVSYGVTALLPIAESHMALHTWPESLAAVVHIYSCRDFNVLLAGELVKDRLHAELVESRVNVLLG